MMESNERAPYDEARLAEASRAFAAALFSRFPELRPFASMERIEDVPGWHLLVDRPAPSGVLGSRLVVWMDQGVEASVGFGRWHDHENLMTASEEPGAERAAVLDLLADLLEDRLVRAVEIGGPVAGFDALLDPDDTEAVLEELTSPGGTGVIRLASFSGRRDRIIKIADFEGGPAGSVSPFELLETKATKLWDYGWFDGSRFRVRPEALLERSARGVLGAFLADPIARRSFCASPDPWGASVERHGPYLAGGVEVAWYRAVSEADLEQRLEAVRMHPDLDTPPEESQWARVREWRARIRTDAAAVFALEVPPEAKAILAPVQVWDLFVEIVAVDPKLETLWVAVMGFD